MTEVLVVLLAAVALALAIGREWERRRDRDTAIRTRERRVLAAILAEWSAAELSEVRVLLRGARGASAAREHLGERVHHLEVARGRLLPASSVCPLRELLLSSGEGGVAEVASESLELAGRLYVFGNRDALVEAFRQVMVNGREASRTGAAPVVSLQLEDAKSWVRVRVRDDGPGFPGGGAGALLEPFSTTKEGHLGLGLWMASRVLRHHAGEMRVVPVEEGGACVEVALPVGTLPGQGT